MSELFKASSAPLGQTTSHPPSIAQQGMFRTSSFLSSSPPDRVMSGLFKVNSFRMSGSHTNLSTLDKQPSTSSLKHDASEGKLNTDTVASLQCQPRNHQYVLGITSVWMFNVTFHNLKGKTHGKTSLASILLSFAVSVMGIVSAACWREPELTPRLGQADIFCAHGIFFSHLLYHATRSRKDRLPIGLQIAFPCGVVSCFKIGRAVAEKGHFYLKAFFHLTFRMIFYWWSILGLAAPPPWPKALMTIVVYYGHAMGSLRTTRHMDGAGCAAHYPLGCAKLLALIAAVEAVNV